MFTTQVCKFFQNGTCKYTADQCRFSHIVPIQPIKHATSVLPVIEYKKKERKEKKNEDKPYLLKKKNTETFEPYHGPSDIRVLISITPKYDKIIQSRDIIIVPNIICKEDDLSLYNKLFDELEAAFPNQDNLWKLWHGDTHMIADDNLHFKNKSPTFQLIISKIEDYFSMVAKSTRFNYYRDDADHKPFHHDASAIKSDKALIQNITVGVSLGNTREIAFEDAIEPNGHRRVISFVLPNGCMYAFSKDINVNWRHGIPQIPIEKQTNKPRISIIAWGSTTQEQL